MKSFHKDVFASLSSLENLWLIGNQLEFFTRKSFSPPPRLKNLSLRGNGIHFSSGDLLPQMVFLETLDLVNNPVRVLPEVPSALPSLRSLYLQDNSIEVLPKNFLSGLFGLKHFHSLEFNFAGNLPVCLTPEDSGTTCQLPFTSDYSQMPSFLLGCRVGGGAVFKIEDGRVTLQGEDIFRFFNEELLSNLWLEPEVLVQVDESKNLSLYAMGGDEYVHADYADQIHLWTQRVSTSGEQKVRLSVRHFIGYTSEIVEESWVCDEFSYGYK